MEVLYPKLADWALTLVGFWAVWLWRKYVATNTQRDAAMLALEAGVEAAWNELGRDLKSAAADGKFSGSERDRLRDLAIARATAIARDQGIDLLRVFTRRVMDSLIKDIVQSRKVA